MRVIHWVLQRKKNAVIVASIVVGVFLLTLVSSHYWNYNCKEALKMLYSASKSENQEEQIEVLQNVLSNYSLYPASKMAALELGNIYYDKGEYTKAIEHYKETADVSDRKAALKSLAIDNIAKSFESMGDYEAAVNYYLMGYHDKNNALRGESYYSAALCYEKLSKLEDAKKIYMALMEDKDLIDPALKKKSEERILWIASTTKSEK